MSRTEVLRSLRGWSWILGALSLVPLVFAVYENWQFSLWAGERQKGGEFVCGTGFVAMLILCAAAASLISLVALMLGLVGYFSTPKPRQARRVLELFVVGIVFIISATICLAAFFLNATR
jgi:hypothetical protein